MPHGDIGRKLISVFALHLAAVSIAVVIGVFGSGIVLKRVLMERALSDEAQIYETRMAADPTAPPPHTYNLRGYFVRTPADQRKVPADIVDLEPGVHHLNHQGSDVLVSVSDRLDGRMYLVFSSENVTKLAYVFGLVPLALLLTVLYITVYLTYRLSHRAISPMIQLARQVKTLDFNQLDDDAFAELAGQSTGSEVAALADALSQLQKRIQRFIARERDFTRDASHELRTPVTVIQIASEMLMTDGDLDDYERRQVKRIQTVSKDMEALIEALLLLAREGDDELKACSFSLNEMVADEVERYRFLLRGKPVSIAAEYLTELTVHGPPSVASIMISNLVRNACGYTHEGQVKVTVDSDSVTVSDTGVGMSAETVEKVFDPFFRAQVGKGGHGVGLTIVKRMSDRFGWPVSIDSEPGVGTSAKITFS